MGSEWSAKSANQMLQALDFASELDAKESDHLKEMMNMLQRFLEIKDSLEAILLDYVSDPEPADKNTAILRQVELLSRQLAMAFEQSGVTAIDCIGQEVDPEIHHVVGVIEDPDADTPTIVQEKVKGYMFRDRLLRRPEVVVSRNHVD